MSPTLAPSLALAALLLTTLACNFPASPSATPPAPTDPPVTYMLSVPTTLPTLPTASAQPSSVPLTPTLHASPTVATPSSVPTLPFTDAGSVLAGVCYAYLQTLDGQTLLFNSASDLAAFYNRVDGSKRCTDAVTRQPFDFSASQIVGTVITGLGCGLDVTYDHTDNSGANGKQTIVVKAQVKGECSYDLVRPLWLVVPRSAGIGAISVIKSP